MATHVQSPNLSACVDGIVETPAQPHIAAIDFSCSPVIRVLATIALALIIIGISSQAFLHFALPQRGHKLIMLFDLDRENNIPTYFSATLMFFAAQFTALVAFAKSKREDSFRIHWALLAALVLCASVDEAASIHEMLVEPMRRLLGADGSGLLYFAWVVPGMTLVVAMAFLFARFLLHLPTTTRNQILAAGAVFLTGAIGVEMLGGEHSELWGQANFTFAMYCAAEESLEMMGVLLYIRAISDYLRSSNQDLTFKFSSL